MNQMGIISAMAWVNKGFAKAQPKQYEIDQDMIDEMKNQSEDSDLDLPVFTQELENLKHRKYDQEEDQHIPEGIDIESDEELENYRIKKTDFVIATTKIEKDFSTLEVYIYEEDKANLFVHHDITLSAYPLAIEWCNINPTIKNDDNSFQKGNFAIISSFLPEIELWNLDIVGEVSPQIILGGEVDQKATKIKKFHQKNKKKLFKTGSHTDSVLCLSLNKHRYNVLASGSADTNIKLWDICAQSNLSTYSFHHGVVSCLEFNPKNEVCLASGGQDNKIIVSDIRAKDQHVSQKHNAQLSALCWDQNQENSIYFATENGFLYNSDITKFQMDHIINFRAHMKNITSLSQQELIPGLLISTSEDKTVKIWDTTQIQNQQPKLIAEKNVGTEMYCGQINKDNPWLFGCGTAKGELFIWDISENLSIVKNFNGRVNNQYKTDENLCTKEGEKNTKFYNSDEEYQDCSSDQMDIE